MQILFINLHYGNIPSLSSFFCVMNYKANIRTVTLTTCKRK